MRKSQIIVLIIAAASVGILYSLPKVVVSDKEKSLSAPATDSLRASSTPHNTAALTPEQSAAIDRLRAGYLQSGGQTVKIKWADSLVNQFTAVNQLDSAAQYMEWIAQQKPSVPNWVKTGDLYYQAYGFAVDPLKSNVLGEKARTYFQKVLAQEPDRLDVKSKMAMTYISTKNPMQGIMLLREVLEKDPKNELALFNLGLLSMQSSQYDKAIARFEQVLAINPDHAQARLYLGISYAETGQQKKAIEALTIVKDKDKDPAVQQTVAEYLKKLNQ